MPRPICLPSRFARAALGAFALLIADLDSLRPLFAQAGDAKDRPGTEQSEIWREIDVPPAPVLTPEQALESFQVYPGFRIELVASEPLVNDPVAIAWDEDGRLWVAEMWAYMPDVDGHGEDQPVSRVVVLEDLDSDGVMDRSTVFLDGLVLPRAVAIVQGGVLIGDPPNLYFCRDVDGDLHCDEKTVLTNYADMGNVEHAENGLLRALDNWIYNAKSNRRFQFRDGELSEDKTFFRGQWGIAQDDYGRLFYNNNSLMLWGDALPWELVGRNPGWKPTAGIQSEVVSDQSVFTNRINVGINRAYRENWLRDDYRMRKADAASAPTIYRGDQFPQDFRGAAFVPEPAGNVVATYRLHDDGIEPTATHVLQDDPKWGKVEFLASTDERFRPVMTQTGPDGCLYVVDMYRGIIQHKTYVTSFLRKQIIERGLDNPVGLGRIYRIVSETTPPPQPPPKLSKASDSGLVAALTHPNGQIRDTAQRLLVDKPIIASQALTELRELAAADNELSRIHALWTLQGRGAIDETVLLAAMTDATAWTRVHAWRVAAASGIAQPLSPAMRDAYQRALESEAPLEKLQAFSSVFEFLPQDVAINRILSLDPSEVAADEYLQNVLISALYRREPAFFNALAAHHDTERSGDWQPIIDGLAQAMRRAKRADEILANLSPASLETWPVKQAQAAIARYDSKEKETDLSLYNLDEQEQIERGRVLYANLCSMCHQPDGKGLSNIAPPLAGASWVTESPTRLTLIVAQGLEGNIEVNGQIWNLVMPPHGQHPELQDGKLADVLTYIRAAWGNNAPALSADQVQSILNAHPNRPTPWTSQELLDL